MLEDRVGKDIAFLSTNVQKFIEAALQRPEIATVNTTYIPGVPQVFAKVDRDKVLKQGVNLGDVYQTLQAFMGGVMVNYFNRSGVLAGLCPGERFRTVPTTSANSTCGTHPGAWCRSPRWSRLSPCPVRNSRCATTAIGLLSCLCQRSRATVRARR